MGRFWPWMSLPSSLFVMKKTVYQRANGHIWWGGIVAKEAYEGRAHYEEFIFGIVNDYTPQA
ncbi:hypothetical protein N7530_003832 [Penicillium desertorum]|uniref:Uncharacterized protein n=1 Tax=Penicillium desertorum TaxID=1303715 RepID=A0A9W9WX30_9EURO|nr:hypothetical protein N7530_003832 [Penicillium desertorum]